MLFTFPSRYWSAIGLQGVFSLAGWSRRIHAGFLVSRATQDAAALRHAACTQLSCSTAALSSAFHSRAVLRWRGPTTPAVPGLGWSPFARHYWGNHSCFLFLRVLRCFSSPRWPPADAGWRAFSTPGCPIRASADQRLHAPPRGFSQLAAPFVASWSLGIRHAPFFTFAIHRRLMPASAAYFGVRSPCGLPLVFPSLLVTTCHRTSFRVENNGFEPLTPCLQSRCSSQLS